MLHGYATLAIQDRTTGETREVIVRANTVVDAERIANDYANDRNYRRADQPAEVKIVRRF
ncbi:hypothetical protein D3877_23560 [Azospirillum cavernae]|uniref:Uncharacterized protein n=1 Tax=Azospirillum cavernae TaxID=2320860 RepID=A0A418VPB1_9PROT|nr:hypothetical protein [Azospirillum cavernae]RJF78110.1 hypothetical protein D3877_23560 [Azospirillum cavernae]